MTGFRSGSIGALLLLALAAVSCGSSRHLQSVTLQPATADAQKFPNGLVQFTASGTFNKPPSPQPLTSKDVVWCMGGVSGDGVGECAGLVITGGTVDQNGVAQCMPGFTGTATVLAGTPTNVSHPIPDTGAPLKVFGSAKLTCP